jgi:hypothetical protein
MSSSLARPHTMDTIVGEDGIAVCRGPNHLRFPVVQAVLEISDNIIPKASTEHAEAFA